MTPSPFALALLLLANCVVAAAEEPRPDILVNDFEAENYGEWKTTGDAFGEGPVAGTLPGQMHVDGYEGKRLVNSFRDGDRTVGTLTSPEFSLERPFLNFLIGGGLHPGETCINLLVGGKVVRTASGPNGLPGGSERLEWHAWDIQEFPGRKARLEIVDRHTGGWGHINIDQIAQSDRRRGLEPQRREFAVRQRYLHFPVKTGGRMHRLKLLVEGKIVREFDVELSDGETSFTAFADVGPFIGQTIVIEALLPQESRALEAVVAADELPQQAELYQERLRPQFHFTSRRGWLNDPNGLVYDGEKYHLFYQHNPFGWNWGNMHWGHAVSNDLIRWQEQPIALYPKAYGDWAFSGSAVVDRHNTAGFGQDDETVLALFFTSTGRGECLALSRDLGQSFTEYAENPVVKHSGRDPKVVWHEPTKHWVMAVYDEPPDAERGIAFYRSANLKDWQFTSRITGFFECPDVFELPVAGKPNESRWVLYGADGRYLLGDFDGRAFHPTGEKQQIWHGNFYAAQTFDNAPHNRRIQIGWARGVTFPDMPFNQQMTVPVDLSLVSDDGGLQMVAEPVKELNSLRIPERDFEVDGTKTIAGKESFSQQDQGDLFDIELTLADIEAMKCGVAVFGLPVVWDRTAETLTVKQVTAPAPLRDGKLALRLLVDRGSVEIFVNGGRTAISVDHLQSDEDRSITLFTDNGSMQLDRLHVWPLTSAWK